jgi:hypothetical protein
MTAELRSSTVTCPMHPWHHLYWDSSGFLVCLPPELEVRALPVEDTGLALRGAATPAAG